MTFTLTRRKKKGPTAIPAEAVTDGPVHPNRLTLDRLGAYANLVNAADGLYAYYLLNPVLWSFTSADHRLRTVVSFAQSTAELAGRRIKVETLSSPWASKAYDRLMRERYGDTHPADVDDPDARDFDTFVTAPQVFAAEEDIRRPVTVLAVRVTTDRIGKGELPLLLSATQLTDHRASLEPLRAALQKITNAVGRKGMNGRPMTAAELKWLTHASIGIGTPIPALSSRSSQDAWDDDEVAGFTDGVFATANPGAGHTLIRAVRDGKVYDSFVSVVYADDFESRESPIDRKSGWLAKMQQFGFHVNTIAVLDVLAPDELVTEAQAAATRARSIARQNEEHDMEPSALHTRAIESARAYVDEVELNDSPETAHRVRGVILVAVSADNLEELENTRFDELLSAARRNGLGLTRGLGQYPLYRAFIPGEPTPTAGHTVQFNTLFFASSMPHIDTGGGDKHGLVLGPIAGGHDMYTLDPWGGASRNKSNFLACVAGMGGGKSTVAGMLADFAAGVAGAKTVVNDPSGLMARLVELPWLKDSARLVDIGSAKAGTLTPSIMIPDLPRSHFANDQEHADALAIARQDRIENTLSAVTGLIPPRWLVDRGHEIELLLTEAVVERAADYGDELWGVVAHLDAKKGNELALALAAHLTRTATMKAGRPLFTEPGKSLDVTAIDRLTDNLLTIIVMKGLKLPPKELTDPSLWSPEVRASLPALSQTEGFSRRVMYSDLKTKKMIITDELGIYLAGQSGNTAATTRAIVETRKYGACYAVFGQTADQILSLAPDIDGLVGMTMLGKSDGKSAKKAVEQIAGLPADHGFEQTLTDTAESGDFLITDWRKRTQFVGVDRSLMHPLLVAALDTTPGEIADDSYDPIGA